MSAHSSGMGRRTPVFAAFRWGLPWFRWMHEGHELHEAKKDISFVHKHTKKQRRLISLHASKKHVENLRSFFRPRLKTFL